MPTEIDIKQAEDIADCKAQIKSLDKKIDYRFDRLELFFNEVEKNSDFRKKVTGGLKVASVLVPVLCVIIVLL